MRSITRTIGMASIAWFVFVVTAPSRLAAEPTSRPAPTVSTQPENPQITAGRERAKRDVAGGTLSFMAIRPEAFFLLEDRPGSEDFHKFEYFAALLADRYGIGASEVIVIPGRNDRACFAQGYDEVMVPAIDAKFGKDVLEKVWKEAGEAKDSKRAEYLERRKAAATQASTKPVVDEGSKRGK